MPAWALKLSAFFITLFVLVGSFDYAQGHVKNENAPILKFLGSKQRASSLNATKQT